MILNMGKRKKARRPTLLRRLLEEIENFVHYYQATMRAVGGESAQRAAEEILEKGIYERILNFTTPPRNPLHQKAREILAHYFKTKGKQAKLEKEMKRYDEGSEGAKTMPKCILCGVEAEDVAQISENFKVLGKAREIIGDEEIPDVLVVSVPVKRLCPYCADIVGVKHPDPGIAEAARYYTDLMKLAVPKLQPEIVPPSSKPKIDVDKVKEALFILQEALIGAARKEEGKDAGKLSAEGESMYAETPEEVAEGWKE